MIPIIEQVKYSMYFCLFGIFIGTYFDYTKVISDAIKAKCKNKNKRKVFYIILSYLFEALVLSGLVYISLEYTFSVANGYAPIQMVLFFGLGYLIYLVFMKKQNHKNIFMISLLFYKFKIKDKIVAFFKNIFYNPEIISKISLCMKKIFKKRKKVKMKYQESSLS